jgi:Divergent InlB B-repeat domain/Putative Ig domain
MKKRLSGWRISLLAGVSPLLVLALCPSAAASTAYGTINNFDCVNDTGVEAHGFEIELDDVLSTDITYTYDYNHYGIPKITQDNSDPARPKVFIRYAATRNLDGTWTAYTAIPSGPITPTDGHQFTNPAVNFGGEHFGAGYYGAPTAVKYNWLIDDGTGNLVHGPPVYIATPTFTYYPPVQLQPAVVQAAIVLPPPEAPPVLQFGEAMWVKDIKTTTHNANKMELNDLVDPDPSNPTAHNWANGEPAEVETEWRILQTEFANAGNPKGVLAGVPQELPGGDEVVTRRYEFYKYTGPIDAESGEAMADAVAPDGKHGVGSVTFNYHIDPSTGEWVQATVDLSAIEVVGDFIGAQMSGFDHAPALGLIDHIPDGELGVPYAARTVVVAGGAAFFATTTGSLPGGTTLDDLTGVFSGTPTAAGVFTFTVNASDTGGAVVSKQYTVTIPGVAPVTSTITASASPADGGTTTGGGTFANGTPITLVATHNPAYAFVIWTENGVKVSDSAVYPFTVSADRNLVASFIPVYTVDTSASPIAGGTTSGGGNYQSGDSVTVNATANAWYTFVNWTEGPFAVSASASYTFTASANRSLVANFARTTCIIGTSASPAIGGSTSGGGTYFSIDSVTVQASANTGYGFLNWTEGGTVVSASASYTFTAGASRALVANFVPLTAVLTMNAGLATRSGGKVEVPIIIENSGEALAQAVTIDSKKLATLDGKAANERTPIILGTIAPHGTATTSLTFTGVKAGTRTLQATLTYMGDTATFSMQVQVP